jgi:hypothetical protein
VQSFSGAGGGCSFNRMPDNLLHTRFNFNIAFLMNDLPRNLRPENDTIIVMFLFQRNDSLKSVWATEGGIHNASSRMQERQWGNWSFGSHSFTEAESNKTSEQSGPLRQLMGGRPWGLSFTMKTDDEKNSECPQFDGVGTRARTKYNRLLIGFML